MWGSYARVMQLAEKVAFKVQEHGSWSAVFFFRVTHVSEIARRRNKLQGSACNIGVSNGGAWSNAVLL